MFCCFVAASFRMSMVLTDFFGESHFGNVQCHCMQQLEPQMLPEAAAAGPNQVLVLASQLGSIFRRGGACGSELLCPLCTSVADSVANRCPLTTWWWCCSCAIFPRHNPAEDRLKICHFGIA